MYSVPPMLIGVGVLKWRAEPLADAALAIEPGDLPRIRIQLDDPQRLDFPVVDQRLLRSPYTVCRWICTTPLGTGSGPPSKSLKSGIMSR